MRNYPERLLPKPHYRIVERDDLMSQCNLCLIRHVDSDKAKFIGYSNTLNPDCINIQSDHLRDLSTNLLGIFQPSDIFLGIDKSVSSYYCDLWDGSEECCTPPDGEYFVDEGRGYYFIPVDELLKENVDVLNVESEGSDRYSFKILHTPTRCNFWHISIRVYDSNDNEVSCLDVSKNRKRRIWKLVKDYLVTSIVRTEINYDDYSVLGEAVYCK